MTVADSNPRRLEFTIRLPVVETLWRIFVTEAVENRLGTFVLFVDRFPRTVNVERTEKSPAVEKEVALERRPVVKKGVDTMFVMFAVEKVLNVGCVDKIVKLLCVNKELKNTVAPVRIELCTVKEPPIESP